MNRYANPAPQPLARGAGLAPLRYPRPMRHLEPPAASRWSIRTPTRNPRTRPSSVTLCCSLAGASLSAFCLRPVSLVRSALSRLFRRGGSQFWVERLDLRDETTKKRRETRLFLFQSWRFPILNPVGDGPSQYGPRWLPIPRKTAGLRHDCCYFTDRGSGQARRLALCDESRKSSGLDF